MTRPTHAFYDGDEIVELVFMDDDPAKADALPLPEGYWDDEDEAIALANLRDLRDQALAESDKTILAMFDHVLSWMASEGVLIVGAAAWTEYRQQLRDLPETVTDVFNPEWPERPE